MSTLPMNLFFSGPSSTKSQAVPIVSKTRYLEKQGELTELSRAGSYFNIRLRFLPVYVFLFNDLFILTNKKRSAQHAIAFLSSMIISNWGICNLLKMLK